MVEYIKVKEAAEYLELTQQLVYKQMRRYVIKCKKINGITYTTVEWLEEYLKNKDTYHHATYKNRPVNDPEKGEYSVAHVCEALGMKKMKLLHLIITGKIRAGRKGSYYVIPQDELDRLTKLEEQKQA